MTDHFWVNHPHFCIYFGNADDNVSRENQYDPEKFVSLRNKLSAHTHHTIQSLNFPKQTHSDKVIVADHNSPSLNLLLSEGDAVITRDNHVGIGVVTADCLPLVLYDRKQHALGVVHAGWKGLRDKVITATIKAMQTTFKTIPSDLRVYLGPSASVCCYEVQPDFLAEFPQARDNGMIVDSHAHLFFDQRRAAILELLHNNITQDAIDVTKNVCTICHPGFCSVRQQKEKAGRQPSIAYLNKSIA